MIKVITLYLLLLPTALLASNVSVEDLQTEWAIVNYQLEGDAQEKGFDRLVDKCNRAIQQTPKKAELLIWRGIIKSSFAGVKGGLGALSLIKEAKADLEQAIGIDNGVLSSSAYTSLGTLYFKAPGWPISFGDDDKAKELLDKSLILTPNDIDSHYFYAEYLKQQGDYVQAKEHFLLAQKTPKRLNRPIADKGRLAEISKALNELEER